MIGSKEKKKEWTNWEYEKKNGVGGPSMRSWRVSEVYL